MPAAARLIALAAMLLVAAAGNTAVRTDPGVPWVPLLVVGVVGAVVAGAPARLWPLPAIWLVAVLVVGTTGATVDRTALVAPLVGGVVALAAALAVDGTAVARDRRRRART